MNELHQQIIFFDGVCNLCNGFVDFLMSRDLDRHFHFSPLQGETAKRVLPADSRERLHSVVLSSQGQMFEKSDAVLMILPQLGGLWTAFRVFWIIPKFLRDMIYDLVAKNRYFIWGKRETCRLPTPEERKRFLD